MRAGEEPANECLSWRANGTLALFRGSQRYSLTGGRARARVQVIAVSTASSTPLTIQYSTRHASLTWSLRWWCSAVSILALGEPASWSCSMAYVHMKRKSMLCCVANVFMMFTTRCFGLLWHLGKESCLSRQDRCPMCLRGSVMRAVLVTFNDLRSKSNWVVRVGCSCAIWPALHRRGPPGCCVVKSYTRIMKYVT